MKKFIPFYDLGLNPVTMWKDSRRFLTQEQEQRNRARRLLNKLKKSD